MQFALFIILVGSIIVARQRVLISSKDGAQQITMGAMDMGKLLAVVGVTLALVQIITGSN